MKSPVDFRGYLRRQWERPAVRENRLLGGHSVWPWQIPIRRPTPRAVETDLDSVKRHVEVWRKVRVGQVQFDSIQYRGTDSLVEVPSQWILRKPSEWVDATEDAQIRREFETLSRLVEQTEDIYHALLVRRRDLWIQREVQEVVQAAKLAMMLEPGSALGQPLRTLAISGNDTKFFERNMSLVTALLDLRYDGEVSRVGLEAFLGALSESEHWLLVVDLDGSLLPFHRMRIRSSELRNRPLPGSILLLVENETSLHQIPAVRGAIAVLGSGFDVRWLEGDWLRSKKVGYWGDIDTWGLTFLGHARELLPQLEPIMMNSSVFEDHRQAAVVEPVIASLECPKGLNSEERLLYQRLLKESRGRLEQEFLPKPFVEASILCFANKSS